MGVSKMVGTPIPTEQELESISKAAQKLWELDENRLIPGRHYSINLQGSKKVYQHDRDSATESLFELWIKTTFSVNQPTPHFIDCLTTTKKKLENLKLSQAKKSKRISNLLIKLCSQSQLNILENI